VGQRGENGGYPREGLGEAHTGGSIRDLCENIPEIVISFRSCILISSNGDIDNGFSTIYRYIIRQEEMIFGGG
jgi:hypothetical protein